MNVSVVSVHGHHIFVCFFYNLPSSSQIGATRRKFKAQNFINPIKLNALETYQAKRYDALIRQGVDAEVRTSVGQAAVPALIDIMTGIGFLGVMLYGGGEIISGEKTNGEFMAFFTAMSLAFDPLRRLYVCGTALVSHLITHSVLT